jgi:hypothetical protein
VADGVDQVNARFAAEAPDAGPVLNRFEAHRHLLKAAVALGYVPDPGTIAQRQVHATLAALYQGSPERRNWLRRELADYLDRRLAEARQRRPDPPTPRPAPTAEAGKIIRRGRGWTRIRKKGIDPVPVPLCHPGMILLK